MNLANKLTLVRILLVPVLVVCLLPEQKTIPSLAIVLARYMALVVFIGAAVTDYYDGKIARARGLVTNFGRLMDPLADKLLVAAAFVALVGLGLFPAWFVIVILFREFMVTGLRTLGTTRGRIIQADAWGKHKTAWQMATIITTLSFLAIRATLMYAGLWEGRPLHGLELEWWFRHVVLTILIVICLVLTVRSGTLYVVRNLDLVR